MKIAIAGATGLVGKALVQKLAKENHNLLIFTRNQGKANQIFPAFSFPNLKIIPYQPLTSGEWQNYLSGCDAVVNLAGEPIAEKKWTESQKKVLLESRKLGTQKIVEGIAQATAKPSVLVNASAIGYYGTSETETFVENSPAGNDFLAEICQNWETEAQQVKNSGVRSVIIRLGIVLGKGGALEKMLTPFKLFAGGAIGTGKQWFSWIHIDDITNLIIEAIKRQDLEGIFNGTAPNPVTMTEFCQVLGSVLNRPSWLPVPEFVLKTLLGDGAKVVLEGQKVLPEKTQGIGFKYQYPKLKEALIDLLR